MLTHYVSSRSLEKTICSVCIANYNGIDLIGECIDSVLAQDCGFNVEIIVHDDASNDGSVAYIRACYPQVNLLVSDENCGFCVSNNRMVNVASGQFILLLNNDARLRPAALQAFYQRACHQKKQGILGLPQYSIEDNKLVDRGNLFDIFLNPYPNYDVERRLVGVVTGGCFWIPLTLWRDLGGFPEWFHTVAEDIYLCCAARLWGYPVEILTDPGFDHWIGSSLGGGKIRDNRLHTTLRRRAWSERNKTFTIIICYPMPWILLIFPLHLGLLLMEGCLLSLFKWDGRLWRDIYWFCLREVWEKRRLLWRKRQFIQSKRVIKSKEFFALLSLMPHKLNMLISHGLPEVR